MPASPYHYLVDVRFSDLDALGHLNNACYLTYMEQARIHYFKTLGLWSGGSIIDIGFIIADAHVIFRSPVVFGQVVRVQARVTRLGTKSMDMEYLLEDSQTSRLHAEGSTVLVMYDYPTRATIPIPPSWRHAIAAFEGLAESTDKDQ